jgi:methyl-accepting chemotaxis protein
VGFGAALLLLLTISVASELTIRSIAADTTNLFGQQLQTERLVTEWKGIIEANVQRAQAAAKTSDPATQKFFEDGIARASKRVSGAQEQIGKLLIDPRAKDLFAKALENRAMYQGHRKAAFDAKAQGDIDQANIIIEQKFVPAGDVYVGSIEALADRQKAAIDEIGNGIQRRSEAAVITILVLSVASIAVALLLGWLITRSLLTQLGGEPDYAAGITDRIAAGDLTVDVALRAGDRSSLLFSIAAMRDRLAAIVGEVRSTTDAVATASNEIASGNMDLSTRTEQQAGSLEETASSMEELTSTVKQNTEHAR